MATLTFNGTTDIVKFKSLTTALGTNLPNGAYTSAVVARKTTAAVEAQTHGLMDATEGTQNYIDLGLSATNHPEMDNGFDSIATETTDTWSSTTNWMVLVCTRAAGVSTTPRFHIADITTPVSFAHNNSTVTQSDHAGPGTTGVLDIGGQHSAAAPWPGQIALVGFWNVAMTDGQVNALITNKKTSDWWTSAAGAPLVLIELNTTTPTDLGANSTFNALTTPALTGPDPTGWTFDGKGSIAAVNRFTPGRMPLGA